MYDAVVFDFDGVVVAPSDRARLRSAARRAFAEQGVADPATSAVERMTVGVTPDELHRVSERYGLDPGAFWRTRDRVASEVQVAAARDGEKSPYPDADRVFDLDVPASVVSSNQQATVDALLAEFDLGTAFETAYGRRPTVEDLRRKKPAPHYVERALSDLGTDRALMVGDSESDVRAAHNAGIDAAFLRRDHRADADLSVEPAHEIASLDALPGLLGE